MILSKEVKGLNMFYLDGKEISCIYIYTEDQKVYNLGRWFTTKYGCNNSVNCKIDLGKVWKQNKLDLSKKRSFYVRSSEENKIFANDKTYDLYIYAGDISTNIINNHFWKRSWSSCKL